ncbi:SRPBCC family protein [Marinobacter sp.]|uniref:SRPBCC family protein n=1 Tax=Marinobacter sp. TaxID=50741 RepID=UPI00384F5067
MGKTYQSVVINAPAEKVWSTLRDFHDLSWAPNIISSVEAVGDRKGDEPGAKRILNEAFHETLTDIDDQEYSISYSIDDGPSPVSRDEVSDYTGRVLVRPVTEGEGGTFVEWYSSWQGKDKEAAEFCHGIYANLLGELKKTLES